MSVGSSSLSAGLFGVPIVRTVLLRLGVTAVLGVFLAGIVVPVHRDGYDCGATMRAHRGESVLYSAADSGLSYRNVLADCHDGFRYRALVLGASGTLGAAIALHGLTASSRRRNDADARSGGTR